VNGAVGDWFAEGLGKSFKTLHLDEGVGVPAVRLETTFYSATQLGDFLEFGLAVVALGRSSVDIEITAKTKEIERFVTCLRVVFIKLSGRKSMAIPSDLRTAMQPYLRDRR
jgi:4-hydroxybenzoyl-CoA thioesterase